MTTTAPPPEPRSPTFGALARRIAGRTTDLVVIGVVLIGGLTLGRQLVEWWRAEPPVVGAQPSASGLSSASAATAIEFGDLPLVLERQPFAGDAAAALERLSAECRAALAAESSLDWNAPGAAAALLDRLQSLAPAERGDGGRELYRVEGPVPVVVGVRNAPRDPSSPAVDPRRVVSVALAAPRGDRSWALYTFRPAAGTMAAGPADIPLPPGARRLLAARGESGEALIGFAGPGRPEEWMAFADRELSSGGWERAGEWIVREDAWSARYVAADGQRARTVDIGFSISGATDLAGLIQVAP